MQVGYKQIRNLMTAAHTSDESNSSHTDILDNNSDK